MPGIIEGIAFMPPCEREQYTENDRRRFGIRKLNLESPSLDERGRPIGSATANAGVATSGDGGRAREDAVAVGCFGATSSSSQQRAQRPIPTASSAGDYDGPDFDDTKPYITYMVAFPHLSRNHHNAASSSSSAANNTPKAQLEQYNGRVVLFAHGNAEDLTGCSYYWHLSAALNAAVVAYDYLGYGWSSGAKKDCTESNAFKAVRRMFDFVVKDCGKDRRKVFVMGRSLGSGSATHVVFDECKLYEKQHKAYEKQLAKYNHHQQQQQQRNSSSQHPSTSNSSTAGIANCNPSATNPSASSSAVAVTSSSSSAAAAAPPSNQHSSQPSPPPPYPPCAGLILYSPLYSAAATASLRVSGIFGDIMCNYSKVGDIRKHVPILLVHGNTDEVIPFICAQRLWEKCGGNVGELTATETPDNEMIRASSSLFSSSAKKQDKPIRKAYFRPMASCGHNNIENLRGPEFYAHLRHFMERESHGGAGGRRVGGGDGGNTTSPGAAAGAAAIARNNNIGSGGGGGGMQLGVASKPVVADDDPVWGKQP